MKKIMYMAVAVIAALSSCSSEEFVGSNGISGEAKVFTATIEGDATSRSTYDATSKKAFWETTDIVSINGVKYQAQSGGAATTTFAKASGETASDPEAPYYAFFADGANTGTGSYTADGQFTLPACYNYAAGKFNMPMYAYSTSSTELGFKNLCGVLAITVPEDQMSSVSSIVLSSDKQLNGAFTATEAGVMTFESMTLTDADKKITLTVTTGGTGNVYYIPVPAGDHTLKITVNGVCNGNITSTMMTTSSAVTIARNKKYNIEFSAKHSYTWNEYVDLGLSVLWATCNVGAKNPHEYGNYYAWGEVTPEIDRAYRWLRYKWCNHTEGSTYKDNWTGCYKYTCADGKTDGCWYDTNGEYIGTTVDGVNYKNFTILEAADDAATANLGSSWRMPTHAELDELVSGTCNGWTSDYNGTGVAGRIFYKKVDGKTSFEDYSISDLHIFMPPTGYFGRGVLGNEGNVGYYWTSELLPTRSDNSWSLLFSKDGIYVGDYFHRCYGRGVRAVRAK